MKIMTGSFAALMGMALIAGAADAGEAHKAPESSKQFSRLKGLVGVWEGVEQNAKEPKKVSVEYSLTAGGSALVEKLFPGTEHKMLSVYNEPGGKLQMTHYCMLGNAPLMKLKKADDKTYQFEVAGASGLRSA